MQTYSVSLFDVVAAGIEPQVGVAVFRTVLLAVIQHTFEHIGNSAVVAAAVAGGQDDNVFVPGGACIAAHALGVLGYAKVPFWLVLEVAWLGRVVVGGSRCNGFAGAIIPVVLDRDVAVEAEQDNEYCDGGDGEDNGPARGLVSTCRRGGGRVVKQGAATGACGSLGGSVDMVDRARTSWVASGGTACSPCWGMSATCGKKHDGSCADRE
jgi:hypothetical protein